MAELRTQDTRKVFEALWAKVTEAPADPERHEKFIDYVAGNNLAKYGVQRYHEAERQGLIDAAAGDRYRKTLAERAAAIVFFRAPQEERKKGGKIERWALYIVVSGVFALLLGVVSGTTIWPGVLMTLIGLAGMVARAVR